MSLLMAALGLSIKSIRDNSAGAFWGGIIILFLNGTLLEIPCVVQGVAAFRGMLHFFRKKDYHRAKICTAFWGVSLLAFLVMYFAPGTRNRMQPPEELTFMARYSFTVTMAISKYIPVLLTFLLNPVTWIVPLFTPSVKRYLKIPQRGLKIEVFLVYCILLAIGINAITLWGVLNEIPPRVISLSLWLMEFGWVLFWVFYSDYNMSSWEAKWGKLLRLRYVLLVLALICNLNFGTLVRELSDGTARMYTHEVDSREGKIAKQRRELDVRVKEEQGETAGESRLVVESLKHYPTFLCRTDVFPINSMTSLIPLAVMAPWNHTWNDSFAQVHGFDSAIALPSEILSDKEAVKRWQEEDIFSEDVRKMEKIARSSKDVNLLYVISIIYDRFENAHMEKDGEAAQRCFAEANRNLRSESIYALFCKWIRELLDK